MGIDKADRKMERYGRGVQEKEGDGGEWTVDRKWLEVGSGSLR